METIFLTTETIKHAGISPITVTTPFSKKEHAECFMDYRRRSNTFDSGIFCREVPMDMCYVRVAFKGEEQECEVHFTGNGLVTNKVLQEGDVYFTDLQWCMSKQSLAQITAIATDMVKKHIKASTKVGVFFAIRQNAVGGGSIMFPVLYTTEEEARATKEAYSKMLPGVYEYSIERGTLMEEDGMTVMIPLDGEGEKIPIMAVSPT